MDVLRDLGVGERLGREGLVHDGIHLRQPGRTIHIPLTELTGRHVTVYGQQEVVKDLIAARLQRGGALYFDVGDVEIHDIAIAAPRVTYVDRHGTHAIACHVIAGCDGFHGVCRPSIPGGVLTEHEYVYPFGWLGILAEAARPPTS